MFCFLRICNPINLNVWNIHCGPDVAPFHWHSNSKFILRFNFVRTVLVDCDCNIFSGFEIWIRAQRWFCAAPSQLTHELLHSFTNDIQQKVILKNCNVHRFRWAINSSKLKFIILRKYYVVLGLQNLPFYESICIGIPLGNLNFQIWRVLRFSESEKFQLQHKKAKDSKFTIENLTIGQSYQQLICMFPTWRAWLPSSQSYFWLFYEIFISNFDDWRHLVKVRTPLVRL